MKLLFLNNYHYLRGGSEQVYFGEMNLFRFQGHTVEAFARRTNDDADSKYADFFPEDMRTDSLKPGLGMFRTMKEIIYSSESKKNLKALLTEFNPDVIHAHNIYGRLTTSVLDLAKEKNIPVVMTLHDYKLICPSYKLMYGSGVCEDCKGGKYYKAVLNKCHKNSFIASAVYAFESWFNDFFSKYKNNISFLIAPSQFLRDKLIEFGWAENQIVYIPNYIVNENFEPDFEPENYLVYIGRLSPEKGIETLVRAFKNVKSKNILLKIAGDGPERQNLENLVQNDQRIEFTGYLSGDELKDITCKAKAVVIPSEWYENAPISILEAFAYGKPVIGARIGGIPEMIEEGKNGFLFESGNADDLTEKLNLFLDCPESEIIQMGKAGRQKVEDCYNPEVHYEKLIQVYQNAIAMKDGLLG
ncbi:MAG: glycosyltransferase family 4 protein [Proteobacteria bacterium]|nr:glycosyltransferase family 4 protein [Pseudomonadota bacterium]MBU1388547.1 glycosyltransferase family 4 protein [Pseudomonadota bacterium]MBU1544844.1 glycosyltransferase family 4 protein [Pseudomonadota bacterium]MBU2482677.1 glycosyltransferase family 4 protein [Pseudomonadota bacterium]